MARVPVISSPCPLRWSAAPQPGKDFCGQCQRRVHNLTGMTEAQRESFFAECSGKVCVSYTVRLPRPINSKVGVGLAASLLVSGAALANDWPTNPQPAAGEYCDPLGEEVIIVGGTNAGKELQWVDEEEAAVIRNELPEVDASEWLPTPTDESTDESA